MSKSNYNQCKSCRYIQDISKESICENCGFNTWVDCVHLNMVGDLMIIKEKRMYLCCHDCNQGFYVNVSDLKKSEDLR